MVEKTLEEDKFDSYFSGEANSQFDKRSSGEEEEPVASDEKSEEEAPEPEVTEEADEEEEEESEEDEEPTTDWEKKYKKADSDRRKTQSERDSMLAGFNQQKQTLDLLMREVQDLKNQRTENPESLPSGNEEELLTVGHFNKAVETLVKSTQKEQHTETITPDMYNETQGTWINQQGDREKVAKWLEEHPVDYDPELSVMSTQEGRYAQIRNKLLQEDFDRMKEENKRLKKQAKKNKKKGKVPVTGPGQGRSSASHSNSGDDQLERFMTTW